MTTPVVMDEAGHTGENLLDPLQPVYALAAFRVDAVTAEAAVAAALGRAQKSTTELKFSSLRKSNVGRRNVLTLLDDLELTASTAAVIVVHKPWMAAAKLIDELVEPRMLASGIQSVWYGTGAAKNMANALYRLGPRALGEMYAELTSSFIAMVRSYTPQARTAFLRTLDRCRIVCRDEQVRELLSIMIDTPDALDAEFANRQDALDPAFTALFWQCGYWSTGLPHYKRGSKCCTTIPRACGVGRKQSSERFSAAWPTAPPRSRSLSAKSPFTYRLFSIPSSLRHRTTTRGYRLPTFWLVLRRTCTA
jgi:hypothetical protein